MGFPTYIAYDTKRRKPGCVLIQAAMGGSVELAKRFPSELWVTDTADGMKLYPVKDEAQFQQLLALTKAAA